jgi:type VI secretion system protein VasG
LVEPFVSEKTVAGVVSDWTGVPLGSMLKDELASVRSLGDRMGQRIVGQNHALEIVAETLQIAAAGLQDPRKPMGIFLLVGPSGVGKTYTAETLAELYYGGEHHMVTINMSEYTEEISVSRLFGSSPGYVGYGEAAVLTEPVRKRPYTLILLDEIEKAHPKVKQVFYEIFDKGIAMDGMGREVNFRNTIIMMTSNLGTDEITAACARSERPPTPQELEEIIRPGLINYFQPALLGRITTVPYYPLGDDQLVTIVRLKLDRIGDLLTTSHDCTLTYDEGLITAIADQCRHVETGARNVDAIVRDRLLPELAREMLARMGEAEPATRVRVGLDDTGAFTYTFE